MPNIYDLVRTSGGVRTKIRLYPAQNGSYGGVTSINEDVILDVSKGAVKFDKAPMKIAETDERQITINLHKLDETDTTLRGHIFAPTGANIASPTATTWNIKYANMWVISDDGGDSGLSENNFIIRFIGVQKDVPEAEGRLTATTSQFDIRLVSIVRYILEGIEPYHVARQITGDETGFQTPQMAAVGQLWDTVYVDDDGGFVIVWDSGTETKANFKGDYINDRGRQVFYRYKMFSLEELFEEIRLTAQYIYRTIRNDVGMTLSMPYALFNNLQFYKQSYNIDDSLGSTLSTGQLYYCGIIERRNFEIEDGGFGGWVETGGLLSTNNALGTIAGYTNCWDLLGDLASNFCAKIIPEFDYSTINLNWLAPRAAREAPATLNMTDIYGDELTWKLGEYRIRGCTAEITNAGANIAEVSDFAAGASENRDEGNVKILFSNLPFSGDKWGAGRSDNIYQNYTNTESFNVKMAENILFYKVVNPAWLVVASTEYVRVHHHVNIYDGQDHHNTPTHGTLDTYVNSGTWEGNIRRMWDNMHNYGVTVANASGLPYRVCYVNTHVLSGNTLLLEGTALRSFMPLAKIGDSYLFSPNHISLGLSAWPVTFWLISVKENGDLLNDFQLLGLGA